MFVLFLLIVVVANIGVLHISAHIAVQSVHDRDGYSYIHTVKWMDEGFGDNYLKF